MTDSERPDDAAAGEAAPRRRTNAGDLFQRPDASDPAGTDAAGLADQIASQDAHARQTARRRAPRRRPPPARPDGARPAGAPAAGAAVEAMHADLGGKLDRVIGLLEALVRAAPAQTPPRQSAPGTRRRSTSGRGAARGRE